MAKKTIMSEDEAEPVDSCRYCGTDMEDENSQFCSDDCKISYAEKHVKGTRGRA
jgi:predicted nucleic acid-binding Zn ribbon protein